MPDLPRDMPCLQDREIETSQDDAFGHRHYARALESLIESSSNHPPYSIGLLGKWGTGKSSIKSIYINSVSNDRKKDGKQRSRAERVHTITFNAWRFGGEDIKRALLKHVFVVLGGDESKLTDALYRRIQKTVQEARSWRDIGREMYEKWPWLIPQVLAVSLILLVSWLTLTRFGLDNEYVKGALAVIFTGIIAYVFDPKRFIVPRYSNFIRVIEPITAPEQYEDLLIKQLKRFKEGRDNLGQKGKTCERLVVFVDDLDRLSAEEMVEGLDAIRTFMEIPKDKLPKDLGIVFVISCDEERVADAIRGRSRQNDLPGAVFTRDDARRFLDRIFQFRLEIPPFPKRDMAGFAKQKLLEDTPEIAQDLVGLGYDIDGIVSRLIHTGVQSPRNALQILNTFVQCWWIARLREREGAGTERAGGLAEGAVTKHPLSLAAICVLRVDFPDFYNDLEREPDLIKRFMDVYVLNLKIEEQPETIRDILSGYQEEKGEQKLKSQHRKLRQYMSSLRSLVAPPSWQPLILLSQDAIIRQYGDDRARRLYDSFISGDVQGVAEELGRDKDSREFTDTELSLLQDMTNDLYHNSEAEQNNAYTALVALEPRLPRDKAKQLLIPAATKLSESHELRWLVGLDGINACLRHVPTEEQRLLAGRLVQELLKTEGDIDFRLPSGELPSLDEAVDLVRQACAIILSVRSQHGLSRPDDQQLLNWITIRRVGIAGKDQVIGFSEADGWIAECEDSLLPDLREGYSEMLIGELEKDVPDDINVDGALERCRKVFSTLWDAGEASRPALYEQLSRCVAVRSEPAIRLASEVMQAHFETPDPVAITTFLIKFAGRLRKDMDEDSWNLEGWEDDYSSFLKLVSERRDAIVGESAGPEFGALAINWSSDDATANHAAQLLDLLVTIHQASAHNVIVDWVAKLTSELPEPCIKWLSSAYPSKLNDEERGTITDTLRQLTDQESVSQEEGTRYRQFMDNLMPQAVQLPSFQDYLRQLLPLLQNRHGYPEYLKQVFPAISRITDICPQAELGNMLQDIFANTQNNPDLFGWLHLQMISHWPHKSDDTGAYDPNALFDFSLNTLSQQPQHPEAPSILKSLLNMVQSGAVEDGRKVDVARAACLVWPSHNLHSLEVIESLNVAPAIENITGLMNGIDLNDDNQVALLERVWRHISQILEPESSVSITRDIISQPSRGTNQEPDKCLRLWLEVQSEKGKNALRTLLPDSSMNDEQRKRLWLQADHVASKLGQAFFTEMLPQVLQMSDSDEISRSVLESENTITKLFSESTDAKRALGKTLLESFAVAPNQTIKNGIASWLKRLKVDGVLKEIKSMGGITQDDIETLRVHFGKSRYLVDKIE